MKISATKLAARAALVFAAQVAMSACGDDDVNPQPSVDAGTTETSGETTDLTTDESSSGAMGTDTVTSEETGSTDPGTSEGSSGGDTSGMSTEPGDAGPGELPDAGGDADTTDEGDAGEQGDSGGDGGGLACYGDEIPSTVDCGAYPLDCGGPPHAFEACSHFGFLLKAEVFQAVFDCYEAQQVDNHCSEQALEAILECYDEAQQQVCVSPVDDCAMLAEECSDMTAADCHEIVAPYSMMWLEIAAWPVDEVSCMTREGIGDGAGCGERLASCLTGLDDG